MRLSQGLRKGEIVRKTEKYKISLLNSLQTSITYRFHFFAGLLILIVPFIIKLCLWKLAFASVHYGEIKGYTYWEIIVYHVFSMVFAYLNESHVEYRIAAEIKEGILSQYLVKPISHMLYWGSRFMGEKFVNAVYVFAFMGLFSVFWGYCVERYAAVSYLPFVIFAVFLSMILTFVLYYGISLLAFWFFDISYFFAAISFILSVMSGEVIPIDVMPEFLNELFSIMPFSYSVHFPVQILMGKLSMRQMIFRLLMQIIWIILLVLACRLAWNRGLEKYESAGG